MAAGPNACIRVYGFDSPVRRFLASIYLAIVVVSARALHLLRQDSADTALGLAAPLLRTQIIYKCTTAFTVGLNHPVVISNLLISGLHAFTLNCNGKLW